MRSLVAVGLGFLTGLLACYAWASDTLVPGRVVVIRNGKLAKFVARPATGDTFSLPPSAPTSVGATLDVFDTSGPAGADNYDLPAVGWHGIGYPAGAGGFSYRGAGTPTDPCVRVLVRQTLIKGVCRGSGVTLTPPFTQNVGVVLTIGPTDRYCAQFGGIIVRNDADLTKRKDASAPSVCPVPLSPPYCHEGTYPTCGGSCPVNSYCLAHPTFGCVCASS